MFKIKNTDIVFAISYNRVVIGGQGAYIEFEKEHIILELITRPGQEYRGKGNYQTCKYFWLTPREKDLKVYLQRGKVSYADYKIGKYYVSPLDLDFSGSLYAEKSDQPGTGVKTTYDQSK